MTGKTALLMAHVHKRNNIRRLLLAQAEDESLEDSLYAKLGEHTDNLLREMRRVHASLYERGKTQVKPRVLVRRVK